MEDEKQFREILNRGHYRHHTFHIYKDLPLQFNVFYNGLRVYVSPYQENTDDALQAIQDYIDERHKNNPNL